MSKCNSLVEQYPALFSHDGKPTLISPIACNDGWYELLRVLCFSITEHCKNKGTTVSVRQVKEKFGGLRFYIDGGDDFVHGLIDFAEQFSFLVCEQCGQKATLTKNDGWLMTTCETCAHKNEGNLTESVSLCPHCHCMTKSKCIEGVCAKCDGIKPE